jgi:hypothetical protein
MASCNQDVDTYDHLTWIRAFEIHGNVVAANQGDFGGSFVWTPESGPNKEVARLRGPRLALIADVALSVSALRDHQRDGIVEAVRREVRMWRGETTDRPRYKAPPPGFRGRR